MNTSWPTLSQEVFSCEKCRLCQTRQNVVLGEGDLHAALLDFPLKQFDALMHVDGELLARVLNLHDD